MSLMSHSVYLGCDISRDCIVLYCSGVNLYFGGNKNINILLSDWLSRYLIVVSGMCFCNGAIYFNSSELHFCFMLKIKS